MSSSIRRHHRQHTGTRLRRLHDAKIERIRRRHRADRLPAPVIAARIATGSASASAHATETAISRGKDLEGSGKSTTRNEESTTRSTTEGVADAVDGANGNAQNSGDNHGDAQNGANDHRDAVDWRKHPIRAWRAWYGRYKQTRFYQTWAKRPKFSYGAYLCVAFALLLITDMMLLWSIDTNHMYDPDAEYSFFRQILDSSYHSLSSAAGILNFFALGMVYLVCVTVINRFWLGTAIFGAIAGIYAFACKIKYAMRTEPILPSDLGFLNGGGGENVASFVTDEYKPIIDHGITLIIWFVVICLLLQFLDRRGAFIHCSWRHPFANAKNIFGNICRIAASVMSVWLIMTYAGALSVPDSSIREFVKDIGYSPVIWNVGDDARANGAATTFLSLTKVKAMDDEPDYNEETMQAIHDRYAKQAQEINTTRNATLTDTTVINVLSETLSDPNRVPGVHFNIDPMPNIHALSNTATTGLMLSPGYGGGTANIEFQQMTGLSMANFNGSMLSPYQQLLPTRPEVFSFNQMWNEACGGDDSCSVGFHPFLQRFYLRNANYKKFKFSHLYTLDSDPKIKHAGTYEGKSGKSGNVTDEQAYQNVIDEVRANAQANKPAQFIELVTMQNHAPYPGIYGDENEFFAADMSNVPDGEKGVIGNYAKGVQRTDEATKQFLDELDAIDKPITVVFYGDHLPGIYTTAANDPKNSIALHETDYFIWSNRASAAHDVKLPESNAAYSSSNYFMAQTAQQLNARVSPYLALLTELHNEIPALSRAVTSGGTWSPDGSVTYLDNEGKEMDPKQFSAKAKQLLSDYRMVQYDMMMGKNHLHSMGFMDLPKQ
ncbi:phosphoglycerol transferase [Bifidobacterium pseudolongum subsp. globosum]|nr:phosphoglycerol transferase [Bifidobacterium pseudolongum subsp. globosum]